MSGIVVTVGKQPVNVKVSGSPKNLIFVPFTFTATEGQSTFTLSSTPSSNGFIIACINGTPQDQAGGDFSLSGKNITFDEALQAGDIVHGVYSI